jgi:hypothetical protein
MLPGGEPKIVAGPSIWSNLTADQVDRRRSEPNLYGDQATLAGALSIAIIESIMATASRNENATAWTEIARAISSEATSLVRDPQNPINIRARGARRRIRLTRKRARAGELVLISDRHTTEESLKKGT